MSPTSDDHPVEQRSAPLPKPAERTLLERTLKWVGAVTAVLSLIFGGYQLTNMVSQARDRARQIDELIGIARAQQVAADFSAAWQSYLQALQRAEEGGVIAKVAGQLDARALQVRAAQEDCAMAWLQHMRTGADQGFAVLVDPLLLVLVRGTLSAEGVRAADLRAHIGWAYFLKSRDGVYASPPDTWYRQALSSDAQNPYAHAYWGHWLLWTHGSLAEARRHFAAAVAAHRALGFVRHIELAQLWDGNTDERSAEFVRVLVEMRQGHELINALAKHILYQIYYRAVADFERGDHKGRAGFAAGIPINHQIELVRATLYDADFDTDNVAMREAIVAMLDEQGGRLDEARAAWQQVLVMLAGAEGTLQQSARAALKRLPKRSAKLS